MPELGRHHDHRQYRLWFQGHHSRNGRDYMNNQMDDFSTQPGVPNAYGLVGAEANSIQPGKRPLSSMSPRLS